jgi:hypothetical protein
MIDEVTELSMNKVLTWLAFKADLVRVQQAKK